MSQKELKDFILSRITLNKKYWEPKIEKFFNENPEVTRDSFDGFFGKWSHLNRSHRGMWGQMYKRGAGELLPQEKINLAQEEVFMALDELELIEFQAEMARFADLFRSKAVEAFNKNDRYTCAIYYTLLMIALNKELKDTLAVDVLKDFLDPPYIKWFLMVRVFAPSSKVTIELSLDESQKKEVVDAIFDRASHNGFGRCIAYLDFSMVENNNLPFATKSQCITFFDFIGICKDQERWPDIRKIW